MPARPTFIEPMTAKIVQALPEGEQWSYEVKFDGYRALIIKDGDRVQIRSRNNNDLTRAYPTVAGAANRLRAESAVVDGEIVAVDDQGRPSFKRSSTARQIEATRSLTTPLISFISMEKI